MSPIRSHPYGNLGTYSRDGNGDNPLLELYTRYVPRYTSCDTDSAPDLTALFVSTSTDVSCHVSVLASTESTVPYSCKYQQRRTVRSAGLAHHSYYHTADKRITLIFHISSSLRSSARLIPHASLEQVESQQIQDGAQQSGAE